MVLYKQLNLHSFVELKNPHAVLCLTFQRTCESEKVRGKTNSTVEEINLKINLLHYCGQCIHRLYIIHDVFQVFLCQYIAISLTGIAF